jgi:hypothetical protein
MELQIVRSIVADLKSAARSALNFYETDVQCQDQSKPTLQCIGVGDHFVTPCSR